MIHNVQRSNAAQKEPAISSPDYLHYVVSAMARAVLLGNSQLDKLLLPLRV